MIKYVNRIVYDNHGEPRFGTRWFKVIHLTPRNRSVVRQSETAVPIKYSNCCQEELINSGERPDKRLLVIVLIHTYMQTRTNVESDQFYLVRVKGAAIWAL